MRKERRECLKTIMKSMMKSNLLLIVALLMFHLLIPSLVLAQGTTLPEKNFLVDIKPLDNRINSLEVASFNVTVQNLDSDNTIIIEPFNDPRWRIYSEPAYIYLTGLRLGPNEEKSFKLLIKPRKILFPLRYSFSLTLRSETNGYEEVVPIKVEVQTFKPTLQDYDNYILMQVIAPDEIDPREKQELKIILTNKIPLSFKGMRLRVKSAIVDYDKMVSVEGNQRKEIVIPINISADESPKNDLFVITLATPDGTVVKEFNKPYTIISYSDFKEERSVKKGFFTSRTTIGVKNNGNSKGTEIVRFKVTSFSSAFTKTQPNAYYTKDKTGKYLVWKVELKPKEKTTIIIEQNYWSLVIFVILACALYLIYYYILRNPISVKKRALVVKLREGGISELKVFINVKNRTGKTIKKVVVIDKLPKIAEVEKSLHAGTLKPTKIIRHSTKGTIIKWELGNLEKYEERILHYRVKSKLSILGWFKLPATAVKFRIKDKEYIIKSNEVKLETPEPKEKE